MADDARYQITPAALQELEDELHGLETTERQAIAERIKTAREWGDLKENAEYHDAKEAQGHLESKILRVQDRIRNAIVVEPAPPSTSVVGLGTTVVVHDSDRDKQVTYSIVTAHEAEPLEGRLGLDSPLAQALVGSAAGDVVEFRAPRGTRKMRIVSLS